MVLACVFRFQISIPDIYAINSDIPGREDTYDDNLSFLEDGVVGLGLDGLLCVDHGLVHVLGVDGFRHCAGVGVRYVGCDLTSSTLCRGLFEWMRGLGVWLVIGICKTVD
jgi:hypothetical protein